MVSMLSVLISLSIAMLAATPMASPILIHEAPARMAACTLATADTHRPPKNKLFNFSGMRHLSGISTYSPSGRYIQSVVAPCTVSLNRMGTECYAIIEPCTILEIFSTITYLPCSLRVSRTPRCSGRLQINAFSYPGTFLRRKSRYRNACLRPSISPQDTSSGFRGSIARSPSFSRPILPRTRPLGRIPSVPSTRGKSYSPRSTAARIYAPNWGLVRGAAFYHIHSSQIEGSAGELYAVTIRQARYTGFLLRYLRLRKRLQPFWRRWHRIRTYRRLQRSLSYHHLLLHRRPAGGTEL